MTTEGDPRLRKDDNMMNYDEVMKKLEELASHDPKDLAGMARFGINVDKAWVISIPKLRSLASEIRRISSSEFRISNQNTKTVPSLRGTKQSPSGERDPRLRKDDKGEEELHKLALAVWDSGIHEARILAGFIDVPELVTEEQMEEWVLDFDSWDVCDQVCAGLFDRTRFAVQKAREWSARSGEFVKRAGFVLMAGLAVHDKKMSDETFVEFLEIIKREAGDERNFVRKAVNWALRTIGKSRNKYLYDKALETANEILNEITNYQLQISIEVQKTKTPTSLRGGTTKQSLSAEKELRTSKDDNISIRAARWVANDAIKELNKEYIRKRFL